MTEIEYIKVANRIKVSLALTILRDILPGKGLGIDEESIAEIINQLRGHEVALFKSYELD